MNEGDKRTNVTIYVARQRAVKGSDGKLRWLTSHLVNREVATTWPPALDTCARELADALNQIGGQR